MQNQASDLLKRRAGQIMNQWEQRASTEVLAALNLESLVLRNSLPELINQIADALSNTIDRTTARIKQDRLDSLRVGQKHGHERASMADYTMDQMIFEYHILRQVICDVMEQERPLLPVEREVIVCAIEQAVNDAATQFSESLRNIQESVASSLTHDLRSPIHMAKLCAQMILKKTDRPDHITNWAKQITAYMDRLDLMVRDLLDASVIRAGGHLPLKIQEFDLKEFVDSCVEEFKLIYGVKLIVRATSSPRVFWSKKDIRRVLDNLVTNAIKYGASETPVTITIEEVSRDMRLSVHNEGEPIPLKEQAILFEKFHRTPAAKAKAGWGLGLTVVKSVAQAHGGTASVESSKDKGTTFTVQMPADARGRA